MALRAVRENKIKPNCPSESNFQELYEVLGNEAAQETIRQSNPTGRHCEMLRVNPSVCTACPVHQNPYNDDEGRAAEVYRAIEQYGHWLEEAEYLQDRQVLGFGPKFEQMTPEEFEVLRLMRQHEAAISARIQGIEIARLIGQLFAKKED